VLRKFDVKNESEQLIGQSDMLAEHARVLYIKPVVSDKLSAMSDKSFSPERPPPGGEPGSAPRLLHQVVARLRVRHSSPRIEQAYVGWIRRYIHFHDKRHPREMGKAEVEAFLSDLAVARNVAASTQQQALAAILFLYREVLEIELPWLDEVVRAKKPLRLPTVLGRDETERLLASVQDAECAFIVRLLYVTGMRLLEALRLRAKDVGVAHCEIVVRDGKDRKDRVTVLPAMLAAGAAW